jgi:hypothetical protein
VGCGSDHVDGSVNLTESGRVVEDVGETQM